MITCGVCHKRPILIIHHMDRNRKNNVRWNLVVLCPSCHLKIHWLHGREAQRINDRRFILVGARRFVFNQAQRKLIFGVISEPPDRVHTYIDGNGNTVSHYCWGNCPDEDLTSGPCPYKDDYFEEHEEYIKMVREQIGDHSW